MRKAEEIYNEIDKVKEETLQIISERGLQSAEEYQAMLLLQYAKEKALNSELITNHFLYANNQKNNSLDVRNAVLSGNRHSGNSVMDDRRIFFPNL